MSRIEGKVAELLNERELVINRGHEDGVRVGMRFQILNPRGAQIRDPDTNEILGSVEIPKIEVKIINVQPHLAVGRTFKRVSVPATGLRALSALQLANINSALTESALGTRGYEVVETLRSEDGFIEKDIDPSESAIKRGDWAVQVETIKGIPD